MKKILISILLMLALAFTASAASVIYDIVEGDVSGTYQIVAMVDDDEGDYRSFANTISFDSNIIIPVSKTTGNVANIAGGTVKSPLLQYSYTYYDADEETDVTISANIKTVSWTAGENGFYTLVFESYMDPQNLPLDGYQVFSMHFKYADGKSENNLTSSSFVVNSITYADGGYNYYGRDDEGKETNITLVNNVVPAPTVIKIPVTAGDIVYLQDGTFATAAETGDYQVPDDIGYVAVNTGKTSQTTYYVDGKTATSVHVNGVVGSDVTSLRDRTPYDHDKNEETDPVDRNGLRYQMVHNSGTRNVENHNVTEVGFIMTAESNYVISNAGADYVLNMDMVDKNYAKKGVAFGYDQDGNYRNMASDTEDDEAWVIKGVFYNIPITETGVKTVIASRPYYKVGDGDAYIYGEITRKSLYDIAKSIKNDTEKYDACSDSMKAYIDEIIKEAEPEEEIIIDVSDLYKALAALEE